MDLRQLRYFVRAVEPGSMGRAAADLSGVTSALSQQITAGAAAAAGAAPGRGAN